MLFMIAEGTAVTAYLGVCAARWGVGGDSEGVGSGGEVADEHCGGGGGGGGSVNVFYGYNFYNLSGSILVNGGLGGNGINGGQNGSDGGAGSSQIVKLLTN